MRKKNFHLTLIILFTIAVLGLLKYLLPSGAYTPSIGKLGKQTGNTWDMGSSSNNISFLPSEESYGTSENGDYESILADYGTINLSSNCSGSGSSGFLSNSNLHANRFEENLYQESNTSNSMSGNGNAIGSSDGGVGNAMVSVSMPIIITEKKEKNEKSEKGDPANSKTTVAGKPSFFSGDDQIMATPPPPPPTPTEAPLDDYYPLIAIACAIFGTVKLLRKPKAIIEYKC